jgi:uncharacterized surface protein with fasciclin (FAS1) repeats
MISLRISRLCVAAGCAAGLALALAACGTSNTTSAKAIGTHTSYPRPASATPTPTPSPVGTDCSMIPGHGTASLATMSTKDAIEAASGNPRLSVFIAAVRAAGLDGTLNARHAFTLMVPENESFSTLSKTDLIHLRNSGDLKKIVSYHALNTRVSPSQFDVRGATYATMEGSSVRLSKSGSTYEVNGAKVICGDIKTSNATVYIINKVLLPPGT